MAKKKKYDEEVSEIENEVEDEDEDEEEEWTPNMRRLFGGHVPPAGCRACGGPYPSCKTSCSMFDD